MRFYLQIALIILASSLIGCGRSEDVTHDTSENEIPHEKVSAVDSMMDFVRSNGLKIGLNAAGKSILQIGVESVHIAPNETASFEAKRRAAYDMAFKRALCKIVEIIQCDVKDESGLCSDAEEGDSSGNKCRLITKTCKGVISGFRILNQVESYDEGGNYQIALLVAWSKKIQDSIDAVCKRESTKIALKPGNGSLGDWVEDTDFALNIGYRLYVDCDGVIWSIGIVLPEDARNESRAKGEALRWASYARGCQLSAEIRCGSSLEDEDPTFDESINVEPLRLIDISNKSIKWFKREVTSPVSGCKLNAIVCAIPCSEF